MTLVEFVHPAKGRATWEICLTVLYHHARYGAGGGITVEQLRSLLKQAHVPKAQKLNIADILAKSAPYVDNATKQGARYVWTITTTGEKHVRSILGLPEHEAEVEHDVAFLEKLVGGVSDAEIAAYLQEAVVCLKVDALRAAIVFCWVAVVRVIQDKCVAVGLGPLNAALKVHDKNARDIKSRDDLCYVKESLLLQVAQDLGFYDKNQKGTLTDCLNLRNKCGHPGKYRPGPKKASSFIEDIVGIVFK